MAYTAMTAAALRIARGALGAGLVLAMSAVAAHGETSIGVNAVVRNSVQMRTQADTAYHPALVRAAVHIGDAVQSGAQSSLQVLLLDKTVFTVGANARITIDRFVYDPDRGASDVALSVARGSFRFMSGHALAGAGRNAITTPVGAIGVRGTIVEGVVGPEARDVLDGERGLPRPPRDLSAATLVVLRGPGPKNQGSDRPGAIDFTVNGRLTPVEQAGMAVLVWGPGQPPFGPFRLSDVASARLTNLLAPPGPDWRKAERDRRAAAGAAVGFLFGAAGHHDNGSGQTTPSGPNRR